MSMQSDGAVQGGVGGAASGAAIGAQYGGGYGALIGGGIGLGVGAVTGGLNGLSRRKKRDRMRAMRAEQLRRYNEAYGAANNLFNADIARQEGGITNELGQIDAMGREGALDHALAGNYASSMNEAVDSSNADLQSTVRGNNLNLIRRGKLGSSTQAEQEAAATANAQSQLIGMEGSAGQQLDLGQQSNAANLRALRLRAAGGDIYARRALAAQAGAQDLESDAYEQAYGYQERGRQIDQGYQDALSGTIGNSLSAAGNMVNFGG